MTGTAFLLLALALVVAAGNWHAVHHGNKTLEYVCKPLTMVVLFGAALSLDVDDTTVKTWFLVAIGLCLLGDIFLMLPQDLFVFGLGAFLLGHLAYIGGMFADDVEVARFGIGAVLVLGAITGIGTRVLRGVATGEEPDLKGPVIAYMAVISVMVATAVGTGHPAAVVGAILFYSSDALIAWNRFVQETANARLVIMVTYHLAQGGLVLSLV